VSRIELASGVGDDLDRILDHLASHDASHIPARIQEIIEAIGVLEHNPLIGRPALGDNRELIIGRSSRGYVALYRYVAEIDTVLVLALRSQREAGYSVE
jgi:plasmid stabilization system protein ParE